MKCSLTALFLLPDHFVHSEGGHPAGDWIYCGKSELQARERCPNAGLLCGGEHFFPKVKEKEKTNKCINYFFSFALTDFSRELPSVLKSELHALNVLNLLCDTQTE